jgi:hypothetical protein
MFTLRKIALLGAASLVAFAMSCSDTDDDTPEPSKTPLVPRSLILSGAGSSYGDIDKPAKGYTQGERAANASKIDIIVFAGASVTPSNSTVYFPMGTGPDGEGIDDFDNYDVMGCPIADAEVTLIKGAETYGELATWLAGKITSLVDDCEDYSLNLANNKGFVVFTSAEKWIAVIPEAVTTSGTTTATFKLYDLAE